MIPSRFFKSIAFRISIAITIVVTATTITVGEMTLREERKILELEVKNKSRYLAELMSHNIAEPLYQKMYDTIFTLLQGSVKSSESVVVFAGVYDMNGTEVARAYKDEKYRQIIPPPYDFNNAGENISIVEDGRLPIYHLSLPVKKKPAGTVGFLRLCITKESLVGTLKNVRQRLYLLGAAIIFMGILLGLWMTRTVLRPILVLSEGVKMVGEGELGVEVPVVGTGEVKELALSFNRMSGKLKELINTIKSAQAHLVRTEKLYAVGEFSAGVAHEIKNPMTSIKMLMQTVRNKRQELTSKDLLVVEEEINRIDNIITEFLAFARPSRAEKSDININDVVDEVITVTKPMMEQSEIHLLNTFASSLPVIRGNSDALKQVFLNIVLNAIQAMEGKGGSLKIDTSLRGNNIYIIIKDSGVGIPPENLNRIFDPFFTTKKKGTGMGLTLTYNLINEHSGKIHVDSKPGEETTVTVELPV